ncbi:MAG: hypothetical protein EOP54_06180 [Sphingobacteriales bacterium]|nr:MAG: hypothetical protein EOP54_06180 [Sphingobacteriales bacterium]
MKKVLLTIASFLILGTASYAQSFNYQGVARNASGAPLNTQSLGIRISILDGSAAGPELYKETHTVTTNAYGLYNLAIGAGTAVAGDFAAINWGAADRYIKVEMDPAGGNSYTDLGTSKLMSVPYAMYALNGAPGPAGPAGPAGATGPQGAAGSANVNGTENSLMKFATPTTGVNSQLIDDGTSVGLNVTTLSPNIKLQVNAGAISNALKATLTGTPSSSIATAGAVYGESTTGIGVIGVSGTQNGVYGLSTGPLGGTVGVTTGTGNGIWGLATGAGVAGFFDGGTTGRGIIVTAGSSGFGTSTPTGRLMVMQPATPVPAIDTFPAIHGFSYTSQGCLKGGVSGAYNTSNYGTGVHGLGYNGIPFQQANTNFGTGNQDLGMYGSANTAGVMGASVAGIGVVGYNKNASFAATTGVGNTYGVYGNAQAVGGAATPTIRYGVYGFAAGAATNYAGYFSGNVQVTGSIAKGSGTFKIDHPQDPENKYLYHSFVESPDMMNVYNGNITTDASGYATVTLPGYFESLNKDFRYQLTVIGIFAQAIVLEKVNGNKFRIQTSQPDVEVSWQVTGIRDDKYAQAHRVVTEVAKEPEFKGKYLHAAEWGQPESKSIDYTTRPKTTQETRKIAVAEKAPGAGTKETKAKKEVAGATLQ